MNDIKPRRLITQPYDFSVRDIVYKIEQNEIILSPEFQRNYRWDINDDIDNKTEDYKKNKRSRLIESLLLNIPIPVIYLAEIGDQEYEVIDGQQRLQTLYDFLNDKFPLANLSIRGDLNNKKFSELENDDKGAINKRVLRCIAVLNESHPDLKYEIFERLNVGSISMTPQEIRNNTLRGSFNNLLKELSKNSDYIKLMQFQKTDAINDMSHEEMILRFFAYYENNHEKKIGDTDYTELNIFLTAYMRGLQNISLEKVKEFENLFLKTLLKVKEFLCEYAFRTYSDKNKSWNSSGNRNMFDAQMLAFADVLFKNPQDITITATDLQKMIQDAFCLDDDFNKSITQASGGKLKIRFEKIRDMLIGVYVLPLQK